MKRLVCCGSYYRAEKPFQDMFDDVIVLQLNGSLTKVPKLTEDDVVLFGGGSDISTSFYKQKPSRYCGSGEEYSSRDQAETVVWNAAIAAKASILGICRGAQLACALSGGSLVQHVTNHAGRDHLMTTDDGKEISVCSVHHQMMNPFSTKHELIAWASEKQSNVYLIEGEKNIEMQVEPEVVFFPETKALGIQYHPEFMGIKEEAVQYARGLVKQYLIKE